MAMQCCKISKISNVFILCFSFKQTLIKER
jgi:hypothetical protein